MSVHDCCGAHRGCAAWQLMEFLSSEKESKQTIYPPRRLRIGGDASACRPRQPILPSPMPCPAELVHSYTRACRLRDVRVVILGQARRRREPSPICPPLPSLPPLCCGQPSGSVNCRWQDPYHGPKQAHGLCFSVPPGVQSKAAVGLGGARKCASSAHTARWPPLVPPSLVNIYKELSKDIPGFRAPPHGNLQKWAEQGKRGRNLQPPAHNQPGGPRTAVAVV